jgi:hypothetical protein
MAYGTIKVDTITFTDAGVDKSVTISGLVQNPTFSGNITVTGTISGNTVQGQTVSGATVTGTTANFVSGVFTTQISGATITGNVGSFTTITGGTVTLTSGVFASGTAAAPSVSIGTTDNGLYSPGTDQVAVATNGTGRLFVDAAGGVTIPNRFVIGLANNVGGLSEATITTGGVFNTSRLLDGSTNPYLQTGAEVGIVYFNADGSSIPATVFRTGGTERLRITSAGLVGIGVSAPAAALDVRATSFTPTNTGSALLLEDRTTNSQALHFYLNNAGLYGSSRPAGGIGAVNSNSLRIAGGGIITGNFTPSVTNFTPSATAAGAISVGGNIQFFTKGSLTAGTDTDLASSERMTITSSGNVGIANASPVTKLDITGANEEDLLRLSTGNTPGDTFAQIRGENESGIRIKGGGSFEGGTIELGGGLRNTDPGTIKFSTGTSGSGSTERARIDSSGRLLVGTSSSSQVGGGLDAALQVESTSQAGSRFSILRRNSNNAGPVIALGKTGGSGNEVVLADDALGTIDFSGGDGTDVATSAARIRAEVDGTPGANDMPGRLVFSTTSDGASSPTERLRITSAGLVGIGTTVPNEKLTVADSGSANVYIALQNSTTGTTSADGWYLGAAGTEFQIYGKENGPITFSPNSTERARIDSSGRLLVGTASTSTNLRALIQATSANSAGGGNLYLARGESTPADGASLGYLGFSDSNHTTAAGLEAVRDGGTWTSGSSQPSRLEFSTTADGASSPTERMRITSAGLVGIGTTSPNSVLQVNSGTNLGGILVGFNAGSSNFYDADLQVFRTGNGTERARIDSSGRLLIGTSAAINSNYGGTGGLLQVAKNGYLPIGFYTFDNSPGETGYCPYVELHRARGTQASPTIVSSDDDLGLVNFYGHDGSTFIRSALIKAVVDGTPGTNDMPGRLVFSTTADGASSPTERLRITSAGLVGIGTASPTYSVEVQNTVSSDVLLRIRNVQGGEDTGLIIDGDSGGIQREYRIGVNTIANTPDLTFSGPTGFRWFTAGTEKAQIDTSRLTARLTLPSKLQAQVLLARN